MREETFRNFAGKLCDYYEKKAPTTATTNLWYAKVKKIPDECVEWLTDKIMEEHETFPRNIPNICWALFYEWRQAHPEKCAPKQSFECDYCHSHDGLIFVWKDIGPTDGGQGVMAPYRFVFRCGHCKQNDIMVYPMETMEQLKADGYYARK